LTTSGEDGGAEIRWTCRRSTADLSQRLDLVAFATDRLIGSKSDMVFDGAPPDLALKDDPLCLQWSYGDGGDERVTVRQGARGSDVQNVYFPFTGSFVHNFLTLVSLDVF
jgi:hypothetical protein